MTKLEPMDRKPKDSIFGWLRGAARERGDIVAPVVSPREWEVLKEWDELNAVASARGRLRGRKTGG